MKIVEYLRSSFRQSMPEWLRALKDSDELDVQVLYSFFDSRVVFYPGSGFDGHAVKVFAGSHSAHCFVYVDYGVRKSEIERHLEKGHRKAFRGYRTFTRFEVSEKMITTSNFVCHATAEQIKKLRMSMRTPYEFYGFLEILERDTPFTDEHGSERVAVMFLGADGHATYDALFCQKTQSPPFAVLLQDHGFGGNWSDFGDAGVIHDIARRTGRLPEFLLVGIGTEPWDGYRDLAGIQPSLGGGDLLFERRLFQRTPSGINRQCGE